MNTKKQITPISSFLFFLLFCGLSLIIAMPTAFAQCTDFTAMGAVTQTYTVPAGVTAVKITAKGADGGDSGVQTAGEGATAIGVFSVSPGDELEIVVGEKGNGSGSNAGGGGGGSGVRDITSGTILVVAGGGGGGGAVDGNPPSNAINSGGNDDASGDGRASNTGGAGGTNGNGGTAASGTGSGGGGINGAGQSGSGGATGGEGGFVANGGTSSIGGQGGFGVGGGGGGRATAGNDQKGGGGGGYSGGAGGGFLGSGSGGPGAGGGSFIDGSAMGSPQCLIAGEDGGGTGSDGMVRICPLPITVPAITITMVSPTMTNENSGTDFVFEFSRDLVECDLTVYFSVGGVNITSSDYTVQTGGTGMVAFDAGEGLFTITFPAGEATVDLTVEVENDNTVESSEELVVTVEADPNP